MRPWLVLLLAVSLAGCFGGGPSLSAEDGSTYTASTGNGPIVDAPEWHAGHRWTWEGHSTFQGEGDGFDDEAGGTAQATRTMTHEIFSMAYDLNGEPVALGIESHAESWHGWLVALHPSDLTTSYPELVYAHCDDCESVWDIKSRGDDPEETAAERAFEALAQFPLQHGQRSSQSEDVWFLAMRWTTEVSGPVDVEVAGTTHQTWEVRQEMTFDLAPDGLEEFRKEFESEGNRLDRFDYSGNVVRTGWYSPSAKNWAMSTQEAEVWHHLVGMRDGEELDEEITIHSTDERHLVEYELAEHPDEPLDAWVEEANINPVRGMYALDVDRPPGNVNSRDATNITLEANIWAGQVDEIPEGHVVYWELMDSGGEILETATGTTFSRVYDEPGAFGIRVSAWAGSFLVTWGRTSISVGTEYSVDLDCDDVYVTGGLTDCDATSFLVPPDLWYLRVTADLSGVYLQDQGSAYLESGSESLDLEEKSPGRWVADVRAGDLAAGTWELILDPGVASDASYEVEVDLVSWPQEWPDAWDEPPTAPPTSASPAPPGPSSLSWFVSPLFG